MEWNLGFRIIGPGNSFLRQATYHDPEDLLECLPPAFKNQAKVLNKTKVFKVGIKPKEPNALGPDLAIIKGFTPKGVKLDGFCRFRGSSKTDSRFSWNQI